MTSKNETTQAQIMERNAAAAKAEQSQMSKSEAEALRRRRAQIAAYI